MGACITRQHLLFTQQHAAFNTSHLAAVMAQMEPCVVDLRHTRQAYRMLSVLAYASLVVLHASCTSSVTAT